MDYIVTNDWAVGEKNHPAINWASYNNEAQKNIVDSEGSIKTEHIEHQMTFKERSRELQKRLKSQSDLPETKFIS